MCEVMLEPRRLVREGRRRWPWLRSSSCRAEQICARCSVDTCGAALTWPASDEIARKFRVYGNVERDIRLTACSYESGTSSPSQFLRLGRSWGWGKETQTHKIQV